MINIGIVVTNKKTTEKAIKYAGVLDKKKYQVSLLSDMIMSIDYACFPTSEVLFFDGIIISFDGGVLARNLHAKKAKKIVWIPYIDEHKENELLEIMTIKNDQRFRIIFDETESRDPELDRKKIFSKTMINPHGVIKDIEDINNVVGEIYGN